MAGATHVGATPAAKSNEPARHATSAPAQAPPIVRRLLAGRGHGAPLAPAVRLPLERSYGARLDSVRVHTGGEAAAAVADFGARALTYGADIFLGPGEQTGDLTLLGHEVAHVVQQRASPALQPFGGGGSLEREADSAAGAAAHGRAFAIQGRTGGPAVQADGDKKSWLGEAGDWLGDVASGVIDFSESIGWRMAEQFVPRLVPILRKGPEGVIDWMHDRVTAGAKAVFDTFMAPVRAVSGVGGQLSAQFTPMLAWARDAAGKIARNDCTPFREAAEKIEDVATRIIQPIVEKLQPVIAKVEQFFKDVWDTIGAPVWEWIKKYFAAQWEMITDIADWIWNKAEPIRKVAASAWTWFKNKLGIGDGPEGQNGILQWAQGKLEAAGDWIKAKLAPYQREVTAIATVVGGLVLLISPAGPILLLGGAIYGVVEGVRWIKANWGKGDAMVKARTYLEKQLIPPLQANIRKVTGGLVKVAGSLAGAVQKFADKLSGAVGAVAGSMLDFAVGAVRWIADQVNAIADWAGQKLLGLVDLVQSALTTLSAFMVKVVDFLGKVANAVIDVWSIPRELLGKVWNAIPACIRDPFVDFIIPLILRQIELFRGIAADKVAWARTKARINTIIKKVFDTRDLMGAVKEAFRLVLDVFNVPEDLLVRIWAKAQSAWDTVVAKPLDFIKNTIRSMARGFGIMWGNKLEELKFGMVGWLTGGLAAKDIVLPKDWTSPRQLFDFALSVLGISMPRVFELLAKRFDEKAVARLKTYYQRIATVVAWVRESIDTSKTPAENTKGIVEKAKDFAGDIFAGIAEWIAGKVATEVTLMATAAAASAGLSEVVDIARRIYKAMLTAQRWMRQVMEMAEKVLDSVIEVATGQIDAAGGRFAKIMHLGMPVVIGFLADQVGLTGVGAKISELIEKLRARVDEGILWLIDKGKAFLDGLVKLVSSGVKALLQWWKMSSPIVPKSGPKHTLTFTDDAGDHKLVVKSTPITLADFVAAAKVPATDTAGQAAIVAIQGGLKQVDDLKKTAASASAALEGMTGNQDKTAQQKKLDDAQKAIQALMDGMSPHIAALLGSGPFGSKENPIPIEYPKRRAEGYQPIYIGPRSDGPIKQESLKNRQTADILKAAGTGGQEWVKKGEPIETFFPTRPRNLPGGGPQIGITDNYKIEIGMVRQYKAGSTEGGRKINEALEPYGYKASIRSGEGRDGDHIVEMQIGGPNILENLWPLHFSENRSSGSLLKHQMDDAKAKIPPAQPTATNTDVWLIISTATQKAGSA